LFTVREEVRLYGSGKSRFFKNSIMCCYLICRGMAIPRKTLKLLSAKNILLEVIDHLQIQKSHFIGISLGTILIRQLAEMHPERVQSMILGGAILKMNFRSRILMWIGNIFKYILPYLVLYQLFAFIIMPKKNHKQSRLLFINEAKKLYQKEFIKWFRLTAEINPVLKWFRQSELNIPTLYIMGREDYMFLPAVAKVAEDHYRSSRLFVIEQCGHVVNVEQPSIFNTEALSFLNNPMKKAETISSGSLSTN